MGEVVTYFIKNLFVKAFVSFYPQILAKTLSESVNSFVPYNFYEEHLLESEKMLFTAKTFKLQLNSADTVLHLNSTKFKFPDTCTVFMGKLQDKRNYKPH